MVLGVGLCRELEIVLWYSDAVMTKVISITSVLTTDINYLRFYICVARDRIIQIDVCRTGTTNERITMDAREYLEILHVAERLKDTPRHCTTTKRRTESVAEHSWRISLMAFLLRHEFKDIDINKVVDMCLIHDLGECFTGDIPTFVKTDSDREVEDSLLNQWVKTLPAELSEDIAALYKEMDAQETKEAKLYKSLDKLEALIQHNESPLDTWSENEFELNKTYAFDTVAFSSWLTELREVILEDTMKKIESGS